MRKELFLLYVRPVFLKQPLNPNFMKTTFILSIVCVNALAQLTPNTVQKFLDKNYVRAGINTANDKFRNVYGNGGPSYEVPVGKGTHAMYCNSMWIGGLNANGLLHIAANTYNPGLDFRPAPLDTTGTAVFTTSNSAPYNKLWKVDCNDINAFVNAFNNGSVTTGSYIVPTDMLTYPAIGTSYFQRQLEPFVDANGDGQYNPLTEGDYPAIKGHQQILSIYNDKDGNHTETNAPALGIEVHERSYAYFDPLLHDTMKAVNYTTYYHYTIYNRSNTTYNNVYITDWADADLGYYSDDFIGTDSLNGFAYCYNGDANDQTTPGLNGYGTRPPVISHALIKTKCSSDGIDNDNDGTIDEANEQFNLNITSYYNSSQNQVPAATMSPTTATQFYNLMRAIWLDNSQFTYGGTGFGGSVPASMMYTGDPSTNTGWTEGSAGNTPRDCRMLLSSGPFTMPAKSKLEWGYAVVFSQDTTPGTNTISQFHSRAQRDVRNARHYDETHQNLQCAPQIANSIKQQEEKRLTASMYPNPVADLLTVELSENVTKATVEIMDLSGRVVMTSDINAGYRGRFNVDQLDKGIYLVKISSGNKAALEKIIRN
jgi:hypothetical protein